MQSYKTLQNKATKITSYVSIINSLRVIQARLSIGVVEMLASNQDISELVHAADLELYKAKTNGRDQVAPALDPVVILQQPRQIRLS